MVNLKVMNLLNFIEQFPDEVSCKSHMKEIRSKEGIICKKCQSKKQYWLKSKWMWLCSDCGFRTTLRSDTMMENSNLPIRTRYLAMAFMTYSKKGISAAEL
jgi:hypothetical protein